MDLKVYKCIIGDEVDSPLEVQAVALVDKPAIMRDFMAFRDTPDAKHVPANFKITDEARRIISGPAMLANVAMYRSAEQLGEKEPGYVYFDVPTIEAIAQKFFAKGFNSNFNIMHDPKQPVQNVCVFESFITDTTRGIQPMKGYEDAPEGSWFISAKVNDEATWQKIVAGEVKGFSVEGLFRIVPDTTPQQMRAEDVLAIKWSDEDRLKLIQGLVGVE